jgi:outer membrane protein assembly factor BamB
MIASGLRVSVLLLIVAALGTVGIPASPSSVAVAQSPKVDKGKSPARKAPARKAGAKKSAPIDVGEATWPQFLGPRRDNVSTETGLLKKWPAGGPKLLGAISGLGVGFSNIAIADNTVYTMGNRGEREFVVAIALDTSEQVWEYDNAPAYHNGYGDGPRGTPTVDGDLLYALGGSGALVCLDRKSGSEVWKKSLVKDFGTAIPGWGICESVLIDGDHLICTPGGSGATMAALDKRSGNVVWKAATPQNDRAAYASAIAVEADGVRQFVNYTASGVIGIRATDGQFLWRDDSSANGTANCCAPVASGNLVLTASGYGKGASTVSLASSDGKTTAKVQYHTNDLKVQHGGLVLLDGHVYGSNDPGILACVELKTGKSKWVNRSVGKGSLTCADGHIILRSEGGPTAYVLASPAGYKEQGRFEPKDRSSRSAWTYPVVCGGKLFLRDQDLLQVYNLHGK